MRTLALLLATVLVAGCGGAKPATSSSAPIASQATAPPRTTGQTATATTVPPTPTATTTTKATGAVNARVPATFTIRPGGAVAPRTITVPPQFPVQLTVISGDGRSHRVILHGVSLSIPAHGQALRLIRGLRPGRYSLGVDGAPKATLTIGGAPGP